MGDALVTIPPSAEEFRRWHLEQSLHAMGAATTTDLNTARQAAALTRDAKDGGADGVLVLSPPGSADVLAYYATVAVTLYVTRLARKALGQRAEGDTSGGGVPDAREPAGIAHTSSSPPDQT